MTWTFDWLTAWPDVWGTGFERQWRALLAAAPHARPFHRPEVVRAWCETRGAAAGLEPAFALATSAEGHQCLLTWIIETRRGRHATRRIAGPAGQADFGYHSPLVVPAPGPHPDWPAFWESARQALRHRCDQASFRFIDPEQGTGRWASPTGELSPVLTLAPGDTLASVLARRSANHRGDVGKKFRRAAERGEVGFHVFGAGESAEARRSFAADFEPAYADIWRNRPSGNLLDAPGMRAFLHRLLGDGIDGGWTHYSRLTIGGEAVAWHLGLAGGQALYFWMPTHKAAWNAVSPGKLLLAMLIEHGIAAGWSQLHFQTGGQDYKRAWTDDDAGLRAVQWRAPSIKGHLLGLYDAWQSRMAR